MSNERLGIFEELQAKRQYVNKAIEARKRLMQTGPNTPNGPYAQPFNPFVQRLRTRSPFWRRKKIEGSPRRTIWPEGRLGLNVVQVMQAVVLESGITFPELMGQTRQRRVAWPRHVAMWMVDRYCPQYSLPDIAYMFDKDHTSIMHGIEATNVRLARRDVDTRVLVQNVRQRLKHIAEVQR